MDVYEFNVFNTPRVVLPTLLLRFFYPRVDNGFGMVHRMRGYAVFIKNM